MAPAKKQKRSGSMLLSRNRVLGPRKPEGSLSAKAGRTLIRKHHTLHKQKAQALAQNNLEIVQKIDAEIEASGGLEKYQQASVLGQSAQRGGDSSKLLMEWIKELQKTGPVMPRETKLRVLEVGCLSSKNAISRSPLFDVTRIDLNGREACIESQDFMERPIPSGDDTSSKFDIISLSLVVNYVPDAPGRGAMLRRTLSFLRPTTDLDQADPLGQFFPSLFLVLPRPCVDNSRYLTEDHLAAIMESLGYVLVRRKLSSKLIYGLWHLSDPTAVQRKIRFKKKEVNPGAARNNFAIVVD